ncbi:hypothetical protein I547_2296 [Mycobacterium kansasii 824]|nr:hypothetical protein I547_2296 [Mycobacterium kansasii 824]
MPPSPATLLGTAAPTPPIPPRPPAPPLPNSPAAPPAPPTLVASGGFSRTSCRACSADDVRRRTAQNPPGNQCKVQLRSLGAGPRSAPGEGGRAS